jgi:hypothetical protein
MLRVNPAVHSCLDYLCHTLKELSQIFLIKAGNPSLRMQTGLKKNLIRIDISQPGDDLLIHQRGFEFSPPDRRFTF